MKIKNYLSIILLNVLSSEPPFPSSAVRISWSVMVSPMANVSFVPDVSFTVSRVPSSDREYVPSLTRSFGS